MINLFPKFKECINRGFNISEAVNDALHALHSDTGEVDDLYDQMSLIITVVAQWFVRYITKKVLQLLTPEGLAINHHKIPQNLVYTYLNFQHHFNFSEHIKKHLENLEKNNW